MFRIVLSLFLLLFLGNLCQATSEESLKDIIKKKKYNVLFLSLDDLRPELGCYGVKYAKTPNFDKIASEGVTFMQAHCQQAICNPSRASLLTGRYPDQIQVWDLVTHFRETEGGRNVVTLPQYFKNNNFDTSWTGKIFHPYRWDDVSWSEPRGLHRIEEMPSFRKWRAYSRQTLRKYANLKKEFQEKHNRLPNWQELQMPAMECVTDAKDSEFADAVFADHAIDKLRMYKKSGKQFFLAVGLGGTHLPFTAPKKYFDLYDPAKIPLPPNPELPKNVPFLAMNTAAFIRMHGDLKAQGLKPPQEGKFPEGTTRALRHAYLACVSFMDTQLGRVLAELESLGMKENTIVCLWGDHGYKLGEHNAWSKMTNFEIDTRCPLIIYHPDSRGKGRKCEAMVEFVDLYPTLADLAGLEVPADLPGKSLLSLLENPDLEWGNASLSQYFRGCMRAESYDGKDYMGYSIRTKEYRYTEWYKWNRKTKKCGERVARELYDHRHDDLENENIVDDIDFKPVIEKLAKTLGEKRAAGKK